MKITVKEKLDNKKIIFDCEYGKSIGYWMDEEMMVGAELYVEIAIPETVNSDNINESKTNVFSIRYEDNFIFLTGVLEQAFIDYSNTLRTGNSLILFHSDKALTNYIGKCIVLKVSCIELYPLNY